MSDLWTTARSNDVEGMRLLFSKGIGLKARDEKGYSFLHHAAERGATKMVTFLLDRGIEADITDNNGFTVSLLDSRFFSF
jgi:ankyrin repeat protein